MAIITQLHPLLIFQSTHSVRSATIDGLGVTSVGAISIHALRAECDASEVEFLSPKDDFNPRTPCGVRLMRTL